MTNKELLIKLKNKGAAWQSQNVVPSLLKQVKEFLRKDEYSQLLIAHSHYTNGEGASEFYEICNKLINKYK